MRADVASPESGNTARGFRGRLVTGRPGEKMIEDGMVVISGERILWCGPTAELPAAVDVETEHVPVILPGLVDVHCHGGAGHTFGADAEGARRAAAFHAAHGTTSVLASLVSAPSSVLLEQIAVLRELVQDGTLAGLHLEGPFITRSMCGAQDPEAIIDGDPVLLRQWLETGHGTVRSLTLAPETAHFHELVALCRNYGVVPSLGHTGATASLTRQALAGTSGAGADGGFGGGGPWSATHLFNRMPPLGHRTPGPIPVLLQAAQQSPEQMVLELVADGVHLDPEIVRMVFGLVGPGAVALVTDAMAAAGMSDGHYTLGRLDVLVQDGVARLVPGEAGLVPGEEEVPAEDRGCRGAIAGATSLLLENVRRCVAWGVPLADAVTAASATPARLMGLVQPHPAQQGAKPDGANQVGAGPIGGNHVGSITTGYRADVLIVTEDLELVRAYKAGRPLIQERNARADYSV